MVYMKLKKFIILLSLIGCNAAPEQATIVQGLANNDNYTPTKNDPQVFNLHLENLINRTDKENFHNVESRRPYLIYYAVDSAKREPFLKYAIDHETDSIRNSCNGKKHQNWVILRNSDIVEKKTYEYCLGGRYSKKDISHILRDIEPVINSTEYLSCEGNNQDPFELLYNCDPDFPLPHAPMTRNYLYSKAIKELNLSELAGPPKVSEEKPLNEMYRDYPLALPHFLFDIMSEKGMFPFLKKDFVPVFHFKSHGHVDYAVTGLRDFQIQKKWDAQIKMLQSKTPSEIGLTSNLEGFSNKVKILEEKASKIISGSEKIGQVNFSEELKKFDGGLSQDDCTGLKTGGLSVDEQNQYMSTTSDVGLSVGSVYRANSIGFTPSMLLRLVTNTYDIDVFESKNFTDLKEEVLYVFIEACDANVGGARWPIWDHQKSVASGVYSGEGSMWYRNIDWQDIFEAIGREENHYYHASLMQYYLMEITRNITTYKSVDHDTYMKAYDSILKKVYEYELGELEE